METKPLLHSPDMWPRSYVTEVNINNVWIKCRVLREDQSPLYCRLNKVLVRLLDENFEPMMIRERPESLKKLVSANCLKYKPLTL